MAIHQTSVYAGIIVSGALSGFIGQWYGWRAAFLSFGAAGILVAILAWAALCEPERGRADFAPSLSTRPVLRTGWPKPFEHPPLFC
jgi:predicted MFS family arabinose efflux permease